MKFVGTCRNIFRLKRRIHLDYASTTPVHPDVYRAMYPFFIKQWANASAIYAEGVAIKRVCESARAELARLLHVRPTDVLFTSGGTESNNLAIIGYIEHVHNTGVAYTDIEIISTRIEHPSISETIKHLEKKGVIVQYVFVHDDGRIDTHNLQSLLSEKTRLITFAYVNSEIGVIQDVKKITRIIRLWNEHYIAKIYVHLDACQAPLWLPCALDTLGVDMLSLDAGKAYGPKGVGVLLKRHWIHLEPILFGGGQEYGLRSGTENTALIVGCTRALVRAQNNWRERSARVQKIRDYFFEKIHTYIPDAIINGSMHHRVPNNINITLLGIDGEYAVIMLDAKGIAVSTRSACGTGKDTGSYVIREITKSNTHALSTLRFTLGERSTKKDIDHALHALQEVMDRMHHA